MNRDSEEMTVLEKSAAEAVVPKFGLEEVVPGFQIRKKVPPSQVRLPPFSGILELFVSFPGQSNSFGTGTGWLIAPNLAVTAAHVLIKSNGLNATKIQLQQVAGGATTAARFFVNSAFRTGQRDSNDFGLIVLNNAFPDAATIGYSAYTNSQLSGVSVNVIGFPDDKPEHELWFTGGRPSSFNDRKIKYKMNTKAGQSGAPVIDVVVKDDKKHYVSVGIHQAFESAQAGNVATRITPAIYGTIEKWRSELG